MRVYRIPTKAWYRKHRLDLTKTWNDIYGNARCHLCKKKMTEKDAYVIVITWRGAEKLSPTHKYQHVECPGAKHVKNTKNKVPL